MRSQMESRVAMSANPNQSAASAQISVISRLASPHVASRRAPAGKQKPAKRRAERSTPPRSSRGRSHQPSRAVLGDPIPVNPARYNRTSVLATSRLVARPLSLEKVSIHPPAPATAHLRFAMATELCAHGGEELVGEAFPLARSEAGVKRGREHLGRHRLLDRRHDRPAALARILDEAGISLER